MLRRSRNSSYLFLGFLLFCWVNLSKETADHLRSFSVASVSPVWRGMRTYLADRPLHFWKEDAMSPSKKVAELELETEFLRSQVEKLSEIIASQQRNAKGFETALSDQRLSHLLSLFRLERVAIPAEVIYRDPSSWSSSLWINVGEETNRALGSMLIAKNSPVVLGTALVGAIDYVGKRQSRVRLLTDASLSPAVRSVRGFSQHRQAVEAIDILLLQLEENEPLSLMLKGLKEAWQKEGKEEYLAKGELHGSSAPLWRSCHPILKGIGFHLEFDNRRTPILKKGDLLVTTGFDGVFPPDLRVAFVSDVKALQRGGYAYEIEAKPIVEQISDLSLVFVLPPRGG